MKPFNFLPIVVMLVMVVTLASCGLTQPGYGDDVYSERPVRSRQIYSDPYYSTAPVIVRDPYTGRYYEMTPVSPYGYETYGYPSGSYGSNTGYGRGYSNRGTNTSSPRRTQSPSYPTQESSRGSETTNKAKGVIRGNQ